MEDYVAQAMALAAMAKAKGGTTDAYTKAETDALLAEKTDETEFDAVTASLIDRGAKNFAPINSGSGDSQYYIVPQGTPITPGNYVVTFKVSGQSVFGRVRYAIKDAQGEKIMSGNSLMPPSVVIRFTAPANSSSIEITIDNGTVSDFMMCTAADYDKSQTYVPHGMTNAELTAALSDKSDKAATYTKADTDELLDGKADLVDGKIPSSELPSYVDDVVEYANASAFPATGESGKIYVATDTNNTYRWGGSAYVEISESLALGETASTAYAGNKGKANADAIAAIKDGTNIDSFSDVETALANIPSVTVDQTYNAQSANAQSGTAVAQALQTIPAVTVDQTFDPVSANAQSGVAVQEAISSDKYRIVQRYNLTGRVISSNPMPDVSNFFDTTFYFSLSTAKPDSLPQGSYIGYCEYGFIMISVSATLNNMHMSGILTVRGNTQYNAGDTFNASIDYIRLIKF